jgi:hypothetical protein
LHVFAEYEAVACRVVVREVQTVSGLDLSGQASRWGRYTRGSGVKAANTEQDHGRYGSNGDIDFRDGGSIDQV